MLYNVGSWSACLVKTCAASPTRAAHHLKAWPLRQLVHAPQHRIVVSMPCRRFSFAASPSGGCGLAGTDRPCMHVLSKYRRRTGPADTYTAVPVDFQGVGGGGSGTFWTSLCRRSSDHPQFRLCTCTHSQSVLHAGLHAARCRFPRRGCVFVLPCPRVCGVVSRNVCPCPCFRAARLQQEVSQATAAGCACIAAPSHDCCALPGFTGLLAGAGWYCTLRVRVWLEHGRHSVCVRVCMDCCVGVLSCLRVGDVCILQGCVQPS